MAFVLQPPCSCPPGAGFRSAQLRSKLESKDPVAGLKPICLTQNGACATAKQQGPAGHGRECLTLQRRRCQGTHDRVREHESENRNVGVREQERRSQGTIRRSQGTYAYSAHSKVRSVCEQCTKCLNWVKCAKCVKSAQKVRKKCAKNA